MMTPQDSMLQAIGELVAQIESANQRMDRDREDRKEAAHTVSELHKDILAAISGLDKTTTGLAAEHKRVEERLAEVEKIATVVTGIKAKTIGAFYVVSLLGAIIIFTFTNFKEQLVKLFWGA